MAEIPINIVEVINTYIIDNNIMYIDPKKLRYVLTVMAQAINQGDASAVDAVLPLLFDSFTNQFSIQQASATTDGYITKEDWLAFSTPYASNIQDGQQLDFPYVDTNTFETPPGYIVISVFTNIALQKYARYTRTSDSVIILDDLQVGDVVSVCGILATGTFILGGFDHFKGVFPTLTALNLALPTANAGDYAQVNEVGSTKVVNYSWDTEDNEWIEGGSGGSGASNTDMLPEGISNLYFTMARVLATVLTGISFVTGGAIVSTDTVLVAFGKIQKQINDILTALDLKAPLANPTFTGSVVVPNATLPTQAVNLSQLKLHNVLVDNNIGDVTQLTGTTANTIVKSYVLPAGFFTSDCVFETNLTVSKIGTAGNLVIEFGVKPVSVTYPIHQVQVASGNQLASIGRTTSVKNGKIVGFSNSGFYYSDKTAIGPSIGKENFDPSISHTFSLKFRLLNISDIALLENLTIKVYKNA